MITAEQALKLVLGATQEFGEEKIPFIQSQGRVLKEDIVADRDFPPFDRVSMDGIAISIDAFEKGQRTFEIEGIQPAGAPQLSLNHTSNCLEVMTGAVLPKNTNAVIRYEDVEIQNGKATILIDSISELQNIHLQGKDRKEGDLLLTKNTIISPAEVSVFATVGKSMINVAKQPKVMIISTGDELVDVQEQPLSHQIRRSNVYTLVSLLQNLKIDANTDHITDDKEALKTKIASCLKDYDVLLFSGAVSKGKFDFLPEVLDELGVKKLFHRVSQRPGKPFWMGTTANCRVFAFPGNPVSTYVNCLVYFYSWFYKSNSVEVFEETAILTEDVAFKPNLTYFLQVKLSDKYGHLLATPVKGNGSGDLASLVDADAFIRLPKTQETTFKQGDNFPVIRYRNF
jgi:molybdopterin molybdotransferase